MRTDVCLHMHAYMCDDAWYTTTRYMKIEDDSCNASMFIHVRIYGRTSLRNTLEPCEKKKMIAIIEIYELE